MKFKNYYMFKMFKSLLIGSNSSEDMINKIVEIRRAKLHSEGFFTESINWDHYKKVLIAKQTKFN